MTEQSSSHSRSGIRRLVPYAATLLIPVVIGALLADYAGHWHLENHPLHALAEGLGAFVAVSIAALIFALRNSKAIAPEYIWVSGALLSMGILDGLHAALHVGELFVWLHSLATFAGGVVFMIIWTGYVPKSEAEYTTIIGSILCLTIAVGGWSLIYPDSVPRMVEGGEFTLAAEVLNVGGGIGFLLGGIYFARKSFEGAGIFGHHCMLLAVAGLLFETSVLWDANWWFWHVLRAIAYGVAGLFFFKLFLDALSQRAEAVQRVTDFAQSSSDWFWEQDENLRFTFVSASNAETSGLKPEDHYGLTRRESGIEGVSEVEWAAHEAALERRESFSDFRFRRTMPDGKVSYISVSGKPIFDEAGVFKGYRGTGRDITPLVESENQLMIARDKAEQASKAKSDFLASMSHELRTPLNAIIGFSQLMIMETFGKLGSPRYLEYMKDIERSSSHLLEIINDILDLSRVEAGEADFVPVELNIPEEVETCVRLAGLQSGKWKHELAFHFEDNAVNLVSDERVFRQILINILSNAAKYTPEGGKISIYTERDDEAGTLCLHVDDTGAGIAEEDIARVLEPFGQARTGSQVTHEGTGLGLSLSSKLMQLAGGQLLIESYVGVGTRVSLSFPANPTPTDERIAS